MSVKLNALDELRASLINQILKRSGRQYGKDRSGGIDNNRP
ncbi:hypothetical protein RAC66_07160 [Pseudomonas sp. LR_1]